MTAYDAEYYRTIRDGSRFSAERIVPALIETLHPRSVLDLGCGVGSWLSVFKELGVERVVGFDGAYVDRTQLRIAENEFSPVDLAVTLPEPVTVDLAMSVEVAEHLGEARADALVDYLTRCANAVWFGAAIPMQGGTDHVNERRQSYWVAKFAARGFGASTELRDRFWGDDRIQVWYRQNALLYVRRDSPASAAVRFFQGDVKALDVVHPDLYEHKLNRYARLEVAHRGYTDFKIGVKRRLSAILPR